MKPKKRGAKRAGKPALRSRSPRRKARLAHEARRTDRSMRAHRLVRQNSKHSPYSYTPGTPSFDEGIKLIVKRRGHTEHYNEKKVYASVYAAALNCHYDEQRAEKLASYVTGKVSAWAHRRSAIDSKEIRTQVLSEIYDEDVAMMYKHHLDIC